MQGLIEVDSPSLELAEVLKLICKVFWSATWMGIPDILLQESQFVGWMTGFHKLLVKPVPQVIMPTLPDVKSVPTGGNAISVMPACVEQ